MEVARPTLHTVAHMAGVSAATASKVLNDREGIAESTRRRVLDAIKQTGYRRSVETAPHRRPAIVAASHGFDSAYAASIVDGMARAVDPLGVDLVVTLARRTDTHDDVASAEQWLAELADATGVIMLTGTLSDSMISTAHSMNIPIVMIDPIDTKDSRVVSIGATNWEGGRTATEHLITLGHRRIAWIGGLSGSIPSIERRHGYASAMQGARLTIDESLIVSGDYTFQTGYENALPLLSRAHPPSGFVCGNDEIALGVIQAAREAGLGVPHDVSVVGFDDTPAARRATPQLTTVNQPLAGMGAMAVETVLSLSRGATPPSMHIQLATSLVVRESTAPPR
ncbi:LacI family DNA-binding transcriptional regulator [Paramicrobacterium agarici]|uniref:LacI family transcriptional regulator n=1 Tax=Paramicrobacterium agarici TaxID=630514 RepID=A0A2A9DWL3_9MICO|nr:LacI family DNA-binding transcriptional regulator [Microbacterium agarici]PFG30525.1 LacI family transcriptional regulator [Microbacterium agarici]TQO23546.1 LacI family transcriptional regulator [Microbacterium agarici]